MEQDHDRCSPNSSVHPQDRFVTALREATERLLRDGPTTHDVASAIGLAQFFPGVFAAAYDQKGRYLWVSESFAEVVGVPASAVLGRSISDMFAADWCRERMRVLQRVLGDGMPLATVEIFRGRRLEAAVLPFDAGTSTAAAAYIGRFGLSTFSPSGRVSAPTFPEVEQLESADWGPLSVLTRRELEVLRFIALGLDNDAIAREIHRTKRAVEWHMQKLYVHLNCAQRTDLFRFGLLAGLHEITDGHWERMMSAVRLEHAPGV